MCIQMVCVNSLKGMSTVTMAVEGNCQFSSHPALRRIHKQCRMCKNKRRKKVSSSTPLTKPLKNCIYCLFFLLLFFQLLTHKILLVTQFLKPETQTPEPHTKSAKPYSNNLPSTQFSIVLNILFLLCKTQQNSLCNTHKSNRN